MFLRIFLLTLMLSFEVFAQSSFAPIVKKVMPSVVSISVTLMETEDAPEIENSLVFKKDENVCLGSGFIADSSGYVLTNRHVVEKAKEIKVKTPDGKEYQAELIGEDTISDVALLKIELEKGFVACDFADSDEVEVGDWILAIGNPFGLESSVAAGIVSAKSRNINETPFDDYIQTDAPINQGNSGGPMFNLEGKVVGLNTLIFSKQGNSLGVGFALPSNQLKKIYQSLKTKGSVSRSYLGVDLKETQLKDYGKALIVTQILDENLAFDNNLLVGDVVVGVEGEKIISLPRFKYLIAWLEPQSEITLSILRQSEPIELLVQTAEMPLVKQKQKNESIHIETEGQSVFYPSLGFGLIKGKIVELEPQSEAASKGVRQGDILLSVDDYPFADMDDFSFYLQEAHQTQRKLKLGLKDVKGDLYFVNLTTHEEQ